jgi:CubicO group peptidase (beta-lactamase class C family)
MLHFVGGSLGLVTSTLTATMQHMAQTRYLTGEPDGKRRPLGWGIETKHRPHVFVADGGTGGSRAFIGFVPEKGIGVVVLSNAANDIYQLGLNLLEPRYERPVWELPRLEIALTAEAVGAYVGRYEEAETGDIYEVTNEGGDLFVQIVGEGRFQVYPETPNEFFYKIADAQHIFLRDEEGAVISMVTRQFGGERLAERVG